MLDEGVYASVSDIGDAELAPDVVEAIRAGKTDQGMMLEQLEWPLPLNWEEQRHLTR